MKSIYVESHDMAGAIILSYPSVQLLVCIRSYVCVLCWEKKKKTFFPPSFFIAVTSHLEIYSHLFLLVPVSSVELYLDCNLQGHSVTHQKQECSLGHAEANCRRKWCYITAREGVICLQIFYGGVVSQETLRSQSFCYLWLIFLRLLLVGNKHFGQI